MKTNTSNSCFSKECRKRGIKIYRYKPKRFSYLPNPIKAYKNMKSISSNKNKYKIYTHEYGALYSISSYPDELYDISEIPDYISNMEKLSSIIEFHRGYRFRNGYKYSMKDITIK